MGYFPGSPSQLAAYFGRTLVCPVCQNAADSPCGVCDACDAALDKSLRAHPGFQSESGTDCAAVFDYDKGDVTEFLFYLKRNRAPGAVDYAALRLCYAEKQLPQTEPWEKTLVTCVPRSTLGALQYGFDQGKRLGKAFVRQLNGAEFVPLFARRGFFTVPQKDLSGKERIQNAQKSFTLAPSQRKRLPSYQGRYARILILDDVTTTGASFEACRKIVEQAIPNIPVYGLFLSKTKS